MTMGDRMAVMKAGLLQQLGSPNECYDTPKNIFVAQFVGSPPMNLVMAKVGAAGDKLRLEVGGSTVEIPESVIAQRPALRSFAGKDIALGIRSEDMEDATISAVPAERRMKGKVTLTELLGSEVIVHFTFPGQKVETEDTKLIEKEAGGSELHLLGDEGVTWVASFAPRSRVRIGDEIEIAVDIERAHYFDPETSDAVWS
jgi:multiple sugar transport system ATP-binding protein